MGSPDKNKLQLFRDVITVLGWQKLVDSEELLVSEAANEDAMPESPYLSVELLLTRFKIPLLSASAYLDSILPKFIDICE